VYVENEITVYRCNDCLKIVGDFQFKHKKGLCPYCGGSHYRGANPNLIETLFVYINFFLWREKERWKKS